MRRAWLLGDRVSRADALRASVSVAVIVSLSIKDRYAIPGEGRRPTATLWFDPKSGEFVTSTAFAAALPAWAHADTSHGIVLAARGKPWVPLDPGWVAAHATGDDEGARIR